MSQHDFGGEYSSNAAENYEHFFVPVIGAPLARDLIARALLKPGERVLDVACGTGIVTRMASEKVGASGAVTGLDLNPGMLAVAKKVSPPGIEWSQASADEIPLPDKSFDVVFCQVSLQFMPDKQKAINEIYRVLAPGGRVLVNVPGPASTIFQELIETLEHNISSEASGFIKQVFSFHNPAEMRQLMAHAGFNEINISTYNKTFKLPAAKDFLWQYIKATPLGATLAEVEEHKLKRLENKVLRRWHHFEEDGHLIDHLDIMLAQAHK